MTSESQATDRSFEKMKRKRSSIKGICTRFMNRTIEILDKGEANVDELEEFREQLQNRETEILAVELEIENLIEDLNELETEIETRQDYRDKIFQLKSRLNRNIKLLRTSENKNDKESDDKEDGSSKSKLPQNVSSDQKLGVTLPKIIIERYKGEPEAWQEFWAQFSSVIHDNDRLSNIDKFTYLKSYLTGSPLTAIQGILVTEKAYETAIDILKRKYGRKDIIVRVRLEALLNLNPVKSASQIRELRLLYDSLEINIKSLENLGIDLNSYGNLLFPIVTKLIPNNIMLEYNRNKTENEEWDVTDLLKYLKNEVETRERTFLFGKHETGITNYSGSKTFPVKGENRQTNYEAAGKRNKYAFNKSSTPMASAFKITVKGCVFCSDSSDHDSKSCMMSVAEKKSSLRKQGICFLCLKRGFHIAKFCSSRFRCDLCGGKHSSLICENQSVVGENRQSAENISESSLQKTEINNDRIDSKSEGKAVVSTTECFVQNSLKENEILLQTCSAQINSDLKSKICTILLDNASQRSFITKDLADELKFPVIRQERLLIYPFSSAEPSEKIYDVVEFTLHNVDNPTKCITVQTLIVDSISATNLSFPSQNLRKVLTQNNIQLSNLVDRNRSKPEILLGAQYFWDINEGRKKKITRSLFAVLTTFGWTLQGRVNEMHLHNEDISVMKLECDDIDLRAFWDLESIGIVPDADDLILDKELIQKVEENLTFEDGRYCTPLLWKLNKKELSNNFAVARRRFESLQIKLKKDAWVDNQYKEIIREQLQNEIVEECDDHLRENSYYMPHRSVVRADKLTTQVRIVYDASSKAENCLSLNDCVHVGPNMNPKILDIILKFRSHEIAFCADIEKAFLMIAIQEKERDYLRFLWFPDELNNASYKILRMTRLPFGMSSSPFLLAITIKHHIKKYQTVNSEAVEMLNSSLYVDDLFHGSDTTEQAFNLSCNAREILKKAGMNLRKFRTNSEELRDLWVQRGIVSNEDTKETSLKVLGINWDTTEDTLKLDVQSLVESLDETNSTKRSILRTVAKIFDPVGFITPFTVRVKCLLQEIWEIGVNWDDGLPQNITKQWKKWCSEIEQLRSLSFQRKYFTYPENLENGRVQLHIFSDASPKAFGAVAYFRNEDQKGNVNVSFIMSKSRVAPLKRLTLPRLELMGAIISARLYSYLKTVFGFSNIDVHFWSDSYIALYWIKGSARNWKPFVANRVVEIQSITDPKCWKHCRSKSNPADYITRGEEIDILKSSSLWWHGPTWLLDPVHLWPNSSPKDIEGQLTEERRLNPERIMQFSCQVDPIRGPILTLENYSSLMKVFRITAWIKRFIDNSKFKDQHRSGALTSEEINEAQVYWVKFTQDQNFREELNCLKKGEAVSKRSCLINFDPFLDHDGIIRVGGRLQKSKFEFGQKCPILLPSKNLLSELLIRQAHENVLHFGVNDTLVEVREQFWILRGRQVVKSVLKKCTICKRYNSRSGAQTMAPLPEDRINQQPPFAVAGLDFAGPIFVKNSEVKHYILLCTCAVTRAIHLELIDSLTTETFLLAFRRFVARRGLCTTVYSDNAKTFHRADFELRTIWKIINHPDVKDFYASHSINWKFIVEKAAWWGGFYERMIRSVKTSLRKIVGKTSLSKAQLETVLVEIEAIVNSRPLTFVYSSPEEPTPLSPAHFLVGRRLTSLPAVYLSRNNFPGSSDTLIRKFNYRERLLQQFWCRWKKEYLFQLKSAVCTQPSRVRELKLDDVVLIHDDKLPRYLWKLGRIIQLFTGRDGKTRSCMLKTNSGVLKRPVQLLFPLEVADPPLNT